MDSDSRAGIWSGHHNSDDTLQWCDRGAGVFPRYRAYQTTLCCSYWDLLVEAELGGRSPESQEGVCLFWSMAFVHLFIYLVSYLFHYYVETNSNSNNYFLNIFFTIIIFFKYCIYLSLHINSIQYLFLEDSFPLWYFISLCRSECFLGTYQLLFRPVVDK